jgi:hypothetical protein
MAPKKTWFLYFLFSHEMISGAYGTLDCLVISQFKSAVCSFSIQLIIKRGDTKATAGIFSSKIAITLPLGLPKRHQSYMRSLQPSKENIQHPALQKIKFIYFFYFCGSFLPYWIRIQGPHLIRIRIHNTCEYIRFSPQLHLFLSVIEETA